jgi:hypothetical protein
LCNPVLANTDATPPGVNFSMVLSIAFATKRSPGFAWIGAAASETASAIAAGASGFERRMWYFPSRCNVATLADIVPSASFGTVEMTSNKCAVL